MLLSLIFILGLLAMTAYVFHLESRLVRAMAVQDAIVHSKSLEEFRTLYTAEVVERARHKGITVTHDYESEPGAIPLPATLSMLLSKRIFSSGAGSARLYSDHYFPWRSATGGPHDGFERDALAALATDPSKPYLRYEEVAGQLTLRYATADLMRASCVDCHNSHPSSPKRDWVVGDVRGVLAVSRPIEHAAGPTRRALRGVMGLLVAVAVFGLAVLAWVAVRLRRAHATAERLASDTALTNRKLTDEIRNRELAEAERLKLEEQVRHAQKLEGLGVLAGGIAHDFNNLLLGMLGNVTLARAKMDSASPAHEHIEMIDIAATRASELTRQLVAYAGHEPLTLQPVNLNHLVRETHELLLTAVEQTATVVLDLTVALPRVEGDRAQLQQVLMNLITNAAEAIEHDHGEINIRTSLLTMPRDEFAKALVGADIPAGQYVVVEVEDNGRGMDGDTRARMFDPFFSTKATGSGLGLSALQGIVRSHAGGLAVHSRLGAGTTVQVLLPSTELKDENDRENDDDVPAKRPPGAVLVVDDQDLVRLTVKLLLEQAGCKVWAASTGQEAVATVEEHGDSLTAVLLDLRMPGMNGQETLRELKKIAPDLRVVMTSGHRADGSVAQLVADGTVGYLQKPYSETELLEQLRVPTTERASSLPPDS